MGEFQEKLSELKSVMQEPGFTTSDEETQEIPVEEDLSNIQEEPVQEVRISRRSHKKREGLKHQLDHARYVNRMQEAQNIELKARLQEKDQLLAEREAQVEEAVNNDHHRYVNSLGLREESILNELKVAKEEGDIQKEIELTQAMAQVAADKSTYGLYKSQINNQNFRQSSHDEFEPPPQLFVPQLPYDDPYQDNEEPENEHFENWLERNPWADPSSRRFSRELSSAADGIASQMNALLKDDGNADVIGTKEYFDSLDNLMKERYGPRHERPQQHRTQHSGGHMVAPVSRNGSSMSDQYVSRNPNSTRRGVALSKEEYAIARNLQISRPNGRMLSSAEAIELYKEGKRHTSNDPLRPNRITFDY